MDISSQNQYQQPRSRTPLKISQEKWEEVQEKIASLVKTNDTLNALVKRKREESEKFQMEAKQRGDGEAAWKKKCLSLENEMHKLAQIEKEVTEYLPYMKSFEEKAKLNEKAIENLNEAIRDKDKLILELQKSGRQSPQIQMQDGSSNSQVQWQLSQLKSEVALYRQLAEQRQKQYEILQEDKEADKKNLMIVLSSSKDLIVAKDEEIRKLGAGLSQIGDYEGKMKKMEDALGSLRIREKHNFECLIQAKDQELANIREQLDILKKKGGKDNQQLEDVARNLENQLQQEIQKNSQQKELLKKKTEEFNQLQNAQVRFQEQEEHEKNNMRERIKILQEELEQSIASVKTTLTNHFVDWNSSDTYQIDSYYVQENAKQQLANENEKLREQLLSSQREIHILQLKIQEETNQISNQDTKAEQLIRQLDSHNSQILKELTQERQEKHNLISKIAILEQKLTDTIDEISSSCSKKLDTETLKIKLECSEEKMQLHNQVVLLQSQLELVQLESAAALRKKESEIKAWAERANSKEEEALLAEQRRRLEEMNPKDKNIFDSSDADKKEIRDLKRKIQSMEDLVAQTKGEKVVYEEKILEFVNKVLELQKNLQLCQRDKEEWKRRAEIIEGEFNQFKNIRRDYQNGNYNYEDIQFNRKSLLEDKQQQLSRSRDAFLPKAASSSIDQSLKRSQQSINEGLKQMKSISDLNNERNMLTLSQGSLHSEQMQHQQSIELLNQQTSDLLQLSKQSIRNELSSSQSKYLPSQLKQQQQQQLSTSLRQSSQIRSSLKEAQERYLQQELSTNFVEDPRHSNHYEEGGGGSVIQGEDLGFDKQQNNQ